MTTSDIQKVRELLASLPDTTDMPVEEKRALYDAAPEYFPLPPDVSVEKLEAEGLSGEWVRAAAALEDCAVLFLHGGGYVLGSPNSHRHLAAAVSQATGASVLLLDYRLAPEHPFPAAVDDAVEAYRWILKTISPRRTAIGGDSAGGGLTVAALLKARDRGDPLPAMGICLSPWVDLTCSAPSYNSKADADPMVERNSVIQYADMYLNGADPKTPLASPLFADLHGLPPLLTQVGSEEVLLDDSINLDRRARAVGIDSTLEIWDDMIHVWHWFGGMLKESQDAVERIGEYFREQIKR